MTIDILFQDGTDDDAPPQQFVLQVDVHTVPARTEEPVPVSPSKMRKRVRALDQQPTNSPDIQPAPLVSASSL